MWCVGFDCWLVDFVEDGDVFGGCVIVFDFVYEMIWC